MVSFSSVSGQKPWAIVRGFDRIEVIFVVFLLLAGSATKLKFVSFGSP